MITGYDKIPANTAIKVIVGGIETLMTGLKAQMNVAIQYNLIDQGVDSYYLAPIDFRVTSDVVTVAASAVIVTGDTLVVTGSSLVKQTATYTFVYTLNGASQNLRNTIDWMIITFPKDYFDKNAVISGVTCQIQGGACGVFYILAQSN